MGEGGKLISDTDDICDRYIMGGYLVTIEIEKAFDSLDHKFILAVKKKNNFWQKLYFLGWDIIE